MKNGVLKSNEYRLTHIQLNRYKSVTRYLCFGLNRKWKQIYTCREYGNEIGLESDRIFPFERTYELNKQNQMK